MVGRFFGAVAVTAALTAVAMPSTRAQVVGGTVAVAPQSTHMKVSSTGTLHLHGKLKSAVTMTMTGAFSVGQAQNLQWDLPLVPATSISGYGIHVKSTSFTFSVTPNSEQDMIVKGTRVRRVTWNTPPANTVIYVKEHLRVRITSKLASFQSSARYPVRGVAKDVKRYLRATQATHLPPHAWNVVKRLARGKKTERAVVESVINWIASRTHYAEPRSNSAAAVFRHHLATCEGYTNLAIAMLRGLNIPAQAVYGWVSAAPIRLHTSIGMQSIQWGQPGAAGQVHAWLNVYFPGTGWVPFDPQLEKYFVDPRHIAFLTAPDATNITMGQWSAYPVSTASVTGRTLSNGSIVMLPGAGAGSKVTVETKDLFSVRFGHEIRDVSRVILYSR